MTRIAVLMGGWSPERAVSLVSGEACAAALERLGHVVTRIDVNGSEVIDALQTSAPEVVFNALHGVGGEDGTIQGVLEVLGLPYTHSGVRASALAMDKAAAKAVFTAHGLPVAPHEILDRRAALDAPYPKPFVIKPVDQGSSVGVMIVTDDVEAAAARTVLEAPDWTHGDQVMVEGFAPGRELTVAVLGGRALAVTEIRAAGGGFYDYRAKYEDGGSVHVRPAEIPDAVRDRALELSARAYGALGCRGLARADLRWDDARGDAGLVLLEVNTQPGMTPTSLAPEQAALEGVDFDALCAWIVEDASCAR